MKNGATLINCARAGIMNEDDLRALKADKGLRYLNDVYPKDEAGDKTVADIADIMLPHLGASTSEANYNAALRSATQLIGYDDKGIASYVVNRDVPEGLDKAYSENWVLITNDKDFGEKVYRERRSHHGIVLLRLQDERSVSKITASSSKHDRSRYD